MAQHTIFVPDSHFCPYSFLTTKTSPLYSFLKTKTPPPVIFPHDKNKNSHLKWAIEEERGFWVIEIPNKATGCLTYKLVLFIPGNKQTK